MDFLAIATNGFLPTPTPTDSQRMAYAATWGYLGTLPKASGVVAATFMSFKRGAAKLFVAGSKIFMRP